MRSSVLARPTLTTGAVLLLFAPLVAGLHHYEADHDGATQHLEAPHGGHEVTVIETGDRIPSTGLNLSSEAAPHSVTAFESAITILLDGVTTRDHHYPARAPPGSRRSRAPPLLS
ncbi:MAG: hypothetical protein O7B29_06885 [Deltaproteobacteria bacterium]|nr:hypothetical protein [Deltaproteobacteria bacterium]